MPDIANAATAAKRKKMLQALAQGTYGKQYHNLPESTEPSTQEKNLYQQYVADKHFYSAFANFGHLKDTYQGRFPLTGTGDTNLYAYFAELAYTIKSQDGASGMVLPAGIISDNATQAFSRTIFNGQIASVYHFDNTEKLFKGVDSR